MFVLCWLDTRVREPDRPHPVVEGGDKLTSYVKAYMLGLV